MQKAPVALLTGAARRLGAAMAERLATEGFHVLVHYNGALRDAGALADRIRAAGGRCDLLQGDLSQRDGVAQVWAAAVALAGPVSLLVNNASTFHNDDIFGFRDAVLDNHMAVNLRAPLLLTESFAAQADLPPGALVVNMLDNKVFAPNPDFFTYSLSKAALRAATELCAMRFAGHPRVCAIAPSITLVSGDQSQADFEASARINPLHRRVSPKDICDALLMLWHQQSLNGQILAIDGGQIHWRLPRDVAFLKQEEPKNG